MTPLERLLAEELPTGDFGGARPQPERPPIWAPTPRRIAEEHREVLLAALNGWEFGEHERAARHLRALPPPDADVELAAEYVLPAAETG